MDDDPGLYYFLALVIAALLIYGLSPGSNR